jgi:hypothetical protein
MEGSLTKRNKKGSESCRCCTDARRHRCGRQRIVRSGPHRSRSGTSSQFPTFTQDLYELVHWLQGCGIRSVAMESTSVYWIPVYQILEARGIEVFLLNAHYPKTFPVERATTSSFFFRLPMDSIPVFRRSAAGQLSSARADLRDSLAVAAPREPD